MAQSVAPAVRFASKPSVSSKHDIWYLVTHNGHLLASFASKDAALTFEARIADIDRACAAAGAKSEVRDTCGRRIAGHWMGAGASVALGYSA